MKLHCLLPLAALALSLTSLAQGEGEVVRLESKSLEVTLDPKFPRLIQYRLKADGAVMEGQSAPVSVVELNGKAEPCQVAFKNLGTDSAQYTLTFPQAAIEVTVQVILGESAVDLRVTNIKEDDTTKLKTLFFPDNALLTIRSSQPDAALAAVFCTNTRDEFQTTFREHVGPIAAMKPGADTGNYLFLSAASLAAGIASGNPIDIQRTAWKLTEKDGAKTLTAWCSAWQYREIDSETVGLPWAKVFITGDRNGDGQATWQDAAIVYRFNMPKPFGHQFVRSTVGENIAMNFASGAQQPFLRILDEIKKCSLATDGLGQQVLIKGFSSEGHDSANTDYAGHWNERAGGLKAFTVLLEHAHDYNARVGIHINASEVYPEAQRYKPEILRHDPQGNLVPGWTWLDHAYMIDKRKDILSGDLFAALDQMRRDLPRLDFVYVDTYWENGWPAWKIASKLNSLGLPMHTEGAGAVDPWISWAHWRDINFTVMRFLWYSDRDLFNNDPILRGGRADEDGFMGWQNQHNFGNFIRSTFSRHLPAKFLKHFELLRWEPGQEAVFSDGVKVAKNGDAVTVTQEGRTLMTWTGGGANSRLFVPWDPKSAAKIYVWDEVGTPQSWDLPPGWRDLPEVCLYKLTDLGRTDETKLPVVDGRVTLAVAKSTPYVLYPKAAPSQQPLLWGEGSPVKDPGFDSRSFAAWKRGPANADVSHIKIESDVRGNPRLVIAGNDGAAGEVSQVITGLEGGNTYAASAWVQCKGIRTASINVLPLNVPDAKPFSNYVSRTNIRHSAPNDPRTGSNYQRLKVSFELPANCTSALLTLKAASSVSATAVEFDDVRVVPAARPSPEVARHYFYEDFENVDQGYGPFTCCPDEYTHLSEAHRPFTDDTINGRFSLKSRGAGRVLRTLPCTLRLKPNTKFHLTCETIGTGHLTAESKGKTVLELKFPGGRGKVTGDFATLNDTESFLSLFKEGGDMIVIDDLAIDDLGPAPTTQTPEPAKVDDASPGRKILLAEDFAKPLTAEWTTHTSKRPGTKVAVAETALTIPAAANVSAFAERALPAGTTAIECQLDAGTDQGQTWGPGLALVWPAGQALRVNVRLPEGCFGVDSSAEPQIRTGHTSSAGEMTLRILLESDKVIAQARADGEDWQVLATFARDKFPGDPAKVRLGKMHGVEGVDDNSDPGAEGSASFRALRAYGKSSPTP